MNPRQERFTLIAFTIVAALIALLTARPYAGSWNDGSRLATVEALVDYRTFAIEESIFVRAPVEPSPYPIDNELLRQHGTRDKLLIDGHYYSDKSPTPALAMAAVYQVWRSLDGPSADARPDLFCLLITWSTSGLAYVLVVLAFFAIAAELGLDFRNRVLLTAFFAVGTLDLPYAQQVNNHILLLAVSAWVFCLLLQGNREGWTRVRLCVIGTLLGIGYTIDLAAGPMLALAVAPLLLQRNRIRGIALVGAAALPWLVLHHIVNYHIAGVFGPANAVPEYLAWSGSPFNINNMTGHWQHGSIFEAGAYALDMLFGKKGFLGHNLLLFLPLLMLPGLLRNRYAERRVFIAGFAWGVGTWLLYAATSINQSGGCCSIRWFVPLLAPGFVAVAIIVRDNLTMRNEIYILGVGSTLLGLSMAISGPWFMKLVPGYWALYATTLTVWLSYRWRSRRPVIVHQRIESAF